MSDHGFKNQHKPAAPRGALIGKGGKGTRKAGTITMQSHSSLPKHTFHLHKKKKGPK